MAPSRPAAPERRGAATAPLSLAQERLWYIHRSAPASAVYNVPLLTRWRERVDPTALRAALSALVTAHEVLRTTYGTVEGRPVQFVAAPGRPVALEVIDRPAPEDDELAARARAPFDLTVDAPLRATLWQDPDPAAGPGTLLITVHHIAVDGWSLPVLYGALAAAYDRARSGLSPALPEPPVQYADFAVWDRAGDRDPEPVRRIGERAAALLDAAAADPTLGVAPPRARVPDGDRRGEEVRLTLPAPLVTAAETLARELRVTPFVVLFAAFQALVQRWSGQAEFLLGTVAANRPHPAVADLVGFFVNTVPLRCAPDPDGTFEELCAGSRAEAFRVLAHQELPFDRLTAAVAEARHTAAGGTEAAGSATARPAALAELGFVLQNSPAPDPEGRHPWEPPTLLPTGTAKQDLSLVLEHTPDGGLLATVTYDTGRYTESTARHFTTGYRALLAAAVAAPATPLRELPVTERPAHAHPYGILTGDAPHPGPATATQALEERLAAIGTTADADRTAVRSSHGTLTLGELDTWTRAIAERLRADGVGPGHHVPVLAARGPALVAGWLGVLRAGAALVPLALDTPAARVEFVLAETGADTALVCAEGAALLAGLDTAVEPLSLDGLRARPASHGGAPAPFTPAAVGPEDVAALLYTSGTTGRPKGVRIPQRGLLNTALWWARDCALGPEDRLLLTAGTAFDPAPYNVLEALLAGAELLVADDLERRDARALLALVRGPRGATVAGSITPSLLHAMLEADREHPGADHDRDPDAASSLRAVYSGGEALPRRLAADCAARWGARIVNVYGPTEASCNSTHASVDPDDVRPPAIGVPLPGTRAYVLGPRREELPPGVPGELYVAGVGVALGYLDRPEQTASAFLPDPCGTPGSLMYRTGDRVLLREDGRLVHLGRADDQLKVLGIRIEPGEVTRLIEEHPAVTAAAVTTAGNPPALVAHVELGAEPPTREELLRPLLRWLPAAVLPAEVYVVDALPRTANDKVDRAALAGVRGRPLPHESAPDTALTPAQRPVAALMAAHLRGVDPERLAPGADFFTLGGHSLLAVRMLAEAERRWGSAVPLRAFLAAPTVAGFTEALEHAAASRADGSATAVRPIDPAAAHPGSPVQQRLWVMDRITHLRTAYLAPGVVEIDGPLDREVLREALARALARHPGLRSRFTLDPRARKVFYRTDGEAPEAVLIDGSDWPPARIEEEVAALCWTPFDLARQAPARGAVIALGDERTLLVIGVHHIVSDGWSLDLLLRDVAALTRHLADGAPLALPTPGHPAAATPEPQAPAGAPAAYLDTLRGAPTDIALPYDRPRGTAQTIEADRCELTLPADLSRRLTELTAPLGVTPFMLAGALLATVLARRGGGRDFLFAFPWAGRDGAAHAETVGMFVNTLLVRADLRDDPGRRRLLERVRESALTAYRYADTPFDSLAAALHPDRDLGRPAVTPVYLGAADTAPTPPAPTAATRARYLVPPRLKAKYELELTVTGGSPGTPLGFSLTHLTALFDAATAEGLLADLARAAEELLTDPEAPVFTETPLTETTTTDPAPAAADGPRDLTDTVAALWAEVLDTPDVEHDVNFFEAGGDSMLLMVLLERIGELTGREPDAADLFEHSTVEAQAAFLEGLAPTGGSLTGSGEHAA
ncbi:amino acid adenylation domain-containing protein [Streptomyces sp. NPDC048606]|uniref:amino acid adenylation domain-containing protein n=1 Tax=Streptomyces sp. NPDC048606 TaxID=3154726 RepID=UPI00342EB55A